MSNINIVPHNDYILLKEEEMQTQTASGLLISGGNDETKVYVVIATGPKVSGFAYNNRVIIDHTKVKAIKHGGLFYGIIKADDIIASVI